MKIPTNLPDAALWFAKQRWSIFPILPPDSPEEGRGKKPAIRGGNGFRDATTDESVIERWWRRQPRCNIGSSLWLGGVPHVVVDDDGGAVAELTATDRPLPATLTVRTRNESRRHYYYRADGLVLTGQPDVPLAHSRAQTRVAGFGYVLLPPSVHPDTGATYAFESDCRHVADAPDWLAALITRPRKAPEMTLAVDIGKLTEEDQLVLQCALDLEPALRPLWRGEWEATKRYASQSEADFAFLSHLYHLGADPGRMQRLFRASGLYRPTKTDSPRPDGTYLTHSINRLIALKAAAHDR